MSGKYWHLVWFVVDNVEVDATMGCRWSSPFQEDITVTCGVDCAFLQYIENTLKYWRNTGEILEKYWRNTVEIVECATGCSAALLPDWTRPLPCQQGPKSTGPAPVYPVDIIHTAVKANTSQCYKIVLGWQCILKAAKGLIYSHAENKIVAHVPTQVSLQ